MKTDSRAFHQWCRRRAKRQSAKPECLPVPLVSLPVPNLSIDISGATSRALNSDRQTTDGAYACKSAFFGMLSRSTTHDCRNNEFSIPSDQSSFLRLREHMTDARSGLRYLSSVVRLVLILLRRLPGVTRHKRKAATRLPTQASNTGQHVYSRSRMY